jgi:hypothetical protein
MDNGGVEGEDERRHNFFDATPGVGSFPPSQFEGKEISLHDV